MNSNHDNILNIKNEVSHRKGLSPIISIVLLLLVTITIFGFIAFFIFDTTKNIKEETETSISNEFKKQYTKIKIENVNEKGVLIRNTGSQDILKDELRIFINETEINATADNDVIKPNSFVTFSFDESISEGELLMIILV